MAILLSLVAATAYGLSDFLGGLLSGRAGPWAVALTSQLGGAGAVLVLATTVDGSPTGAHLLWALAAGVGNGLGTAFLYRGLSAGRMGVVAPVSGVGAALVPVVVGVATGERPAGLVWLGILAAAPAIWLVAREPGPAADSPGTATARGAGVLDGVVAGLGFGALFAALAQIPERAGLLPLALNQLVAAGVVALVATALRAAWVPRSGWAAAGVVSGCLGALATGCFMVATRGGHLTVSAVITSLYPAVTVLLAAALLRERVHRAQAVGLALCAAAVTLVAVG